MCPSHFGLSASSSSPVARRRGAAMAAASNGEPQAAAQKEGEGEGAKTSPQSPVDGGGAPVSPPARRTWRAAGTPVGGLFRKGSPSPPPKRPKKAGEAGDPSKTRPYGQHNKKTRHVGKPNKTSSTTRRTSSNGCRSKKNVSKVQKTKG